jgi:hypothetical protein
MKIMKMNDEKKNLSQNPNIEHKNQYKPHNVKDKNMKCGNKNATKFLL